MKIIIAGVTGLVGQEILEVLEELSPQVDEIVPVASGRSLGKKISFAQHSYEVISFEQALHCGADYAIFSAGSGVSKEWAPKFASQGIMVIDNSSAWRKDNSVPLIVPEVNAHQILPHHRVIANPNCSTIQMVVALAPLHHAYQIKRIVVSTYQSVSGSGNAGIEQLEEERRTGEFSGKAYPHQIDKNALPEGGQFLDNGYSAEEMKLVDETRKIFDEPDIGITSTVVRIPVSGGHSEAINLEFYHPYDLNEARELLKKSPNIAVEDNPSENLYPMPAHVRKSNYTHVGRLRRDESLENGLNLWVVADNLRKGAATNAVQILNYLIEK